MCISTHTQIEIEINRYRYRDLYVHYNRGKPMPGRLRTPRPAAQAGGGKRGAEALGPAMVSLGFWLNRLGFRDLGYRALGYRVLGRVE